LQYKTFRVVGANVRAIVGEGVAIVGIRVGTVVGGVEGAAVEYMTIITVPEHAEFPAQPSSNV